MADGDSYRPRGAVRGRSGSNPEGRRAVPGTPERILKSEFLSDVFYLAARAHGSDRRPSDGRLFLEHVTEVAGLLHRLDFDEELIAVGLLHSRQ